MQKWKFLLLFSFYQEGLKTDEFSFQPVSLLKIEFFSKIFLMFFAYFQETYFDEQLASYTSKDTFTLC